MSGGSPSLEAAPTPHDALYIDGACVGVAANCVTGRWGFIGNSPMFDGQSVGLIAGARVQARAERGRGARHLTAVGARAGGRGRAALVVAANRRSNGLRAEAATTTTWAAARRTTRRRARSSTRTGASRKSRLTLALEEAEKKRRDEEAASRWWRALQGAGAPAVADGDVVQLARRLTRRVRRKTRCAR